MDSGGFRLASSLQPTRDALTSLRRPLRDVLEGRLVELSGDFLDRARRPGYAYGQLRYSLGCCGEGFKIKNEK